MNRTEEQGDFSERDRFVLEALEPHITARLSRLMNTGGIAVIQVDDLNREFGVTKREAEVMTCIAYGMAVPEIAAKLIISERTVEKHLENIYRKVGVNNRMSLMKLAQQYMKM